MDINELTLGQAKELAELFCPVITTGEAKTVKSTPHPMIGKHCVVRTYSDGVHIGTVAAVDGTEVLLKGAHRIWAWRGAFTLSEVATKGIADGSRLSCEVAEVYLTQAISFTPTTETARSTYGKYVGS